MFRILIAAALTLALTGCQRSAAPPAAVTIPMGSLTTQLKAEGDRLLAQGAYERAVVKYQAALNEAPHDVTLRFSMAVALSYLPRREETVEHFMFVMRRGIAGSAEVTTAREWLAKAGELGDVQLAALGPAAPPATSGPEKGKVSGKISWQNIDPSGRMVRVTISLTGDDPDTRDVRLGREFKIGRVFEFRDVPPGSYQLVGEAGSTTMWDLKVVVAPGKESTVDLTDANSVSPKDFTPPEG